MKTKLLVSKLLIWWRQTRLMALGLALASPIWAFAVDQQTFSGPQEAVDALVAAAKHADTNALNSIFGPERQELLSPDAVQATEAFNKFVQRLTEKVQLATNSNSTVALEIGADGWPFPIPLVKQNDRWFFDTAAGKDEILARRIGRDEIGAINVCIAYVDAQREYACEDRMGDGVLAYAQYLHSTPGAHDGLFWPVEADEALSPLGPLVAQARVEGYHHTAKMINEHQAPYHGYYFKILTRQGKHAPGGKHDYIINGRMIAGFALVAWPAEWKNTGVMTFIVNQQGKICQKNLGPDTAKIANDMTAYDPDDSWTPAQ